MYLLYVYLYVSRVRASITVCLWRQYKVVHVRVRVLPPPPTIQDLLKPLDCLHHPLLQTHTHIHTPFFHSSHYVCALLRALIWLAAICFVKQWSIWLTGGAEHIHFHGHMRGFSDKNTHRIHAHFKSSFSSRLLQPRLFPLSVQWSDEQISLQKCAIIHGCLT